jgi:hypothetical protein
MLITAIDPGPRLSAYVVLHGAVIVEHGKVPNLKVLQMLRASQTHGPLVVEMIAPYGKIVGREVMETLVWIGRFLEAWPGVGRLLERKEVKKALGLRAGGSMAATDADVRSALIQRWGGKSGKRQPAPPALTGITKDEWAALAVAVAWREQHGEAFAAVEEAALSGLEDLNRALGLAPAESSTGQAPADSIARPASRAPVASHELLDGAWLGGGR